MDQKQAYKHNETIGQFDDVFVQIERVTEEFEENERKHIRKVLGNVLGEIYSVIELPIYEQHPGLPNRRDGNDSPR